MNEKKLLTVATTVFNLYYMMYKLRIDGNRDIWYSECKTFTKTWGER